MRRTVHLIGDDFTTSSVVQRELATDYRVFTYCSALQLPEQLRNEPGPRCVVLDVSPPGLAGQELKAAMGKSGSTLPIMFFTKSAKDWMRGPPIRRLVRQINKAM